MEGKTTYCAKHCFWQGDDGVVINIRIVDETTLEVIRRIDPDLDDDEGITQIWKDSYVACDGKVILVDKVMGKYTPVVPESWSFEDT